MKDVITYVGIDAHKKDLYLAMLVGAQEKATTWQVANEPAAVRRASRQAARLAAASPMRTKGVRSSRNPTGRSRPRAVSCSGSALPIRSPEALWKCLRAPHHAGMRWP